MKRDKCYQIEVIYHCPKCKGTHTTFEVRGIADVLRADKIQDVLHYIEKALKEVSNEKEKV